MQGSHEAIYSLSPISSEFLVFVSPSCRVFDEPEICQVDFLTIFTVVTVSYSRFEQNVIIIQTVVRNVLTGKRTGFRFDLIFMWFSI